MSSFIRDRLNLPGVAPESTNPIKYQIIDGRFGVKLTDQSKADASINISMSDGLGGALATVRIINLAQKRVDRLKYMAKKNQPITIKLGYSGFDFKDVGKFYLLGQEQGFITQEEDVGSSFNSILELRALEAAAWVCQHVKIAYSSQEATPVEHCRNIIAKANRVSPLPNIAVALPASDTGSPVLFESHYTSIANILLNLADSFGFIVQSIGNNITFSTKVAKLRKSEVTIDGNINSISFKPLFEYKPQKSSETDTEFDNEVLTQTGYTFSILGNPNVLMWSQIDAKNVDFEKGEPESKTREDLIITEVEHRYESKRGYICSGRLTVEGQEAPEDPTKPVAMDGSTDQSFTKALSNLADSVVKSKKPINIGDVTAVDDEDYNNNYRTTITTGADVEGIGKDATRYSRSLDVPLTEEESAFFQVTEKVSVLSPYMGHGYGLFLPVESESELKQRAILINHENESDPILIGYVLTNKMSADTAVFPKHNSGDIYLHTKAHSKLLLPTRVDGETLESEVGSGVLQTKSFVLEVGEVYLTVDRPTPDSPNKIRITHDYGGDVNHIILNDDGKIRIIHKATSETAGDASIVIEDGKVTITATDFQFDGNLAVDGTIEATGNISSDADVSGLSGSFGP